MENGSSSMGADDIHVLQNRVLELERRLAEAQATTLVGAVSKDNGTLRRFEQLFAHGRDIILFIRPDDGQILGANAAAIRAYGYSHAELRALTIHTLRAPDTKALIAGQMAIADTEDILVETTHRRKEGSFFSVEVSSQSAIIDGEPTLISVVLDITERKQEEAERARLIADTERKRLEEALREARDRAAWLARLPGENPNPVVRVSDTGIVLYHNPAAAQLPGWTCAIDQPLSPALLPLVERAMARRREVQQDIPLGERVYLISAMPLPGEGYANLYGRDITERKQAEEALRLSEARLRRLVEANIIGVVTRDTAGQITDANHAFLKMVGYTIEELRAGQLDISQLLPEEFQHLEKQIVEEVLTSSESQPYEKEYIRQDGQRVPVLVGYALLEGSPDQLIGFVLDLTELKRAQTALSEYAEKLKHSNQELEQFAFVASHDLQEPLRKIIRFGDSLADRLNPDMDEKTAAEAGDYLRRMQNAAERMRAMIDGLLELSRVSRQGKALEIVDLAHIAAEVISDLEPRILKARGQVQIGSLPKIEADPLQMHQLIQNLIANALKFHKTETPPVVIVHSKVIRSQQNDPGRVVLQVEDNGIGFDEQDAGRIFQPFQRLHGRGKYEGTGMGLAICQKIVERHHGTITVRSQPGMGAIFMIELPLRRPA